MIVTEGIGVGVSVGEGVCVGTGVLVDSIVGSGLGVAGTSVGGAASGVDVAASRGMVAVGAAAGMGVVGSPPASPVRPSSPQAMTAMIDNVNKPNRLMLAILFCIVISLIQCPWMSNQTCSPTMLRAEIMVPRLLPIT